MIKEEEVREIESAEEASTITCRNKFRFLHLKNIKKIHIIKEKADYLIEGLRNFILSFNYSH